MGIAEGLEDVTSGIGSAISGVVDGITSLGDRIGGFFTGLLDGIGDFFAGLLDGIGDLLEYLFVPKGEFGGDLMDIVSAKFPIIDQLEELFDGLLAIGDVERPKFEITYYDTTVSIVDFEPFEKYLPIVHGIISAVAWFTFLFRLYKRLPALIGGFHPL